MSKVNRENSKSSGKSRSQKSKPVPEFDPAPIRSAFTAPTTAKKEKESPKLEQPNTKRGKKFAAKSKSPLSAKPPVCKRGSKLCKDCFKANPINCNHCKSCKAEFPKKDKVGVVGDLIGLINNAELGVLQSKVTIGHLKQLKSYLEQQIFKDDTFKLGKRQDNPFDFDIKEQLVKNLEGELKMETNQSEMKIMFNKEVKTSFSKDSVACGFSTQIVDDRLFLTGKLGYHVQCFKLVPVDSNRVLMLTGLNLTDKCDDEVHDDMDLFTVETQDHYGIRKLCKVGRAYTTPSYVGCFLINIKKDKKKDVNSFGYSLVMNARHFIPTSSDAMHIDVLHHDVCTDHKILFSLVGSNGKCEVHSIRTQSLTAQPQTMNPLNSNVQIMESKILDIIINSELISTCKLVSEIDMLIGTQNGTLYWIKMNLRAAIPTSTIIWSANNNRNFLVSNICQVPTATTSTTSINFAASWTDGSIKVFNTDLEWPIFDYQSMSVAY